MHRRTYDAVRALEAWLGENTKYTLDIPPLPDGADAVEQFLFVDKRGFCMQIASSLTVMLRSLGVPAALASPASRRARSRCSAVSSPCEASDAHAWVEVWFPGVGWQGFDPTASVPLAGEYSNSSLARLVAGSSAASRRCCSRSGSSSRAVVRRVVLPSASPTAVP